MTRNFIHIFRSQFVQDLLFSTLSNLKLTQIQQSQSENEATNLSTDSEARTEHDSSDVQQNTDSDDNVDVQSQQQNAQQQQHQQSHQLQHGQRGGGGGYNSSSKQQKNSSASGKPMTGERRARPPSMQSAKTRELKTTSMTSKETPDSTR